MTQKQANLILATVSLVWGLSYLFMKLGVDGIPPSTMVALRCGIAFVITGIIFMNKMVKISAKALLYSSIAGALLFGIFVLLIYGVEHTSATSAGFLTSTTVIMVPILQAILNRKFPAPKIVFGVMIVSFGLLLLTVRDQFAIDVGAIYCLIAALLYAIHIIVSNRFVREVDALQLGILQLGFAAFLATVCTFVFEEPVLPSTPIHWGAILGLALICSAYGFVMQSVAQKYTTPESVGFLFSLEPIFSAIFAFIFLKESIGLTGYLGATLILIGVFIANRDFKK
ncbi:DMT family transporter [Cohnella terricola]|uniref:DMT family transporter n=1 Tax=Cohnella terricola TaxID=1289167 RepID=A0A559JIY7_9BACL|nr:DMT family transporter [Cohnella terricola]TVX99845.1 DMT family transporter [Cohnella terricola]